MRKLIISLTSLAILLTGCYKEDVQTLLDDVNTIEGSTIPSMQQQINSIDASVKEIEAADAELQKSIATIQNDYLPKISEAASTVNTLSADVENMKNKEAAMNQAVDDLRKFVEDEAASKTWMEATFATLDEQVKLQEALTGVESSIKTINKSIEDLEKAYQGDIDESLKTIRAEISEINKNLLTKIDNVESGIKKWVNEKFDAYYTASKTQSIVDSLATSTNNKINSLDEDIRQNAADIAENVKSIQKLGENIEDVRDEVTEGYKKAIREAILDQGGAINKLIAQQIDDINARMKREVASINEKIEALEARVAKLEEDIRSLDRKINTIDGQIAAIDETITELKRIDSILKDEINSNKNLSAKQIDTLKKADAAINAKISELRDYINDSLNGTKDWAEATFATLAQHDALQQTVAALKTNIISIENGFVSDVKELETAISDIETKLTTWVNQELQSDYDDLNAKINALREDVKNADDKLKEDILKEISETQGDLTAAITEALNATLKENDGLITDAISKKFKDVTDVINANYNTLNELIKELRKDVDKNTGDIKTINEQIEGINKTIDDLLKVEARLTDAFQKADGTLKEALEKELSTVKKTIADLTAYVGTLPEGTKETNLVQWVNATFATLEHQSQSSVAIDAVERCLDSLAKVVSADSIALAKELDKQVKDLKSLISSAKISNEEYVGEQLKGYVKLSVYEAKIAALDKQIAELSATDENLAKSISDLKKELETKAGELQGEYKEQIASAILQAQGTLNSTITSEIAKVNSSVVALTSRVDQLEKDYAELEARVDACESNITDIQAILAGIGKTETVKALIDAVQAKVTELADANGKSIKELEEAVAALQKETAEISGLADRIETAEGKITVLESLVGQFKSEELNAAIVKLQEELRKAVEDNAKSVAELSKSIEEIEKTISVLDDFGKKLTEAQSDIDNLEAKVGEIKSEDLKKAIEELISDLEELKGDSDKSLSDLDAAITALQTKIYTTDNIVERIILAESEITSLNEKVDTIHSANLKKAIEELNKALNAVTGDTTISLEQLEKNITALEKQIYETDRLVGRIDDAEKAIEALEGKVGDFNSEDLDKAIKKLQADYATLLENFLLATGNNTMSIEEIEDAITTINGTLTSLGQSITAINETIDGATGIKAAIASINTTLLDVYDKITVDGMISNLNQTLTAAIETSVTNIINGASNGYKTLADLQGHIERIDASITTITGQISAINTSISNVYTIAQVDAIKSELQTAITNEITTAIANLVNGATGEYDTLGEIETAIKTINETLKGIGTSITDIGTALGNRYTKDEVIQIKTDLETALTNAINGVIAGATEGYKTLEDIEGKIKAILSTLDDLDGRVDEIEDQLKDIYTKTEVDDIKDKLDKALKDAIDSVVHGASTGYETLKGIETKINEIKGTLDNLGSSITSISQSLSNYYTKTQVDSISTELKNALSGAINGLVDGATDGFKTLKQVETTIAIVKSSLDDLTIAIGTINDKLADYYTKTQVDSIKTKLSEAIEKGVNDAVSGLVNGASTGYQTLKDIEERLGEVGTTLSTYGNSINDIKTALQDIYTKGQVDSIDTALKKQIKDGIDGIVDNAADGYNTLKGIQTKIKGLSDNISSISTSITDIEAKLSDRFTKAQINNMLDSLKTVVMVAIVGEATEGYKTLADIEGKLKGIDTSIEGINTSIATINTTLGTIYSKHQVDSIKTVIGDETAEAIRTAISGVIGNAGTGYQTLGDIEARLSEVGTTLTTYGNSIDGIKTALKGIYTKTQVDSIDTALKGQIAKAVTDLISGAGDDYNTLKKIQTKIEGLSRDISSINTSISGIETKLSDRFTKAQVNHMLDSLKTVVIDAIVDGAEEYQTIKDVETKLKTIDTSIEGINTAISGIQTQLGKIYTKTQVDSISDVIRRELATEVTGLLNGADKYKDFKTVQGHIDTLYAKVTKIGVSIEGIKTQLSGMYTSSEVDDLLSELETDIKSAIIGGAVEGYKTLGDIQTKLTGLDGDISTINASITRIDGALANVFTKTQVDSVHTYITGEISAAVTGLLNGADKYKDFKTVQGHIDTLYKRVSAISGDIVSIKVQLSGIYTKTEVDNLLSEKLIALKSAILGTATGNFQTLGGIQTEISNLNNRIDGLSETVDGLETTLSGKFNTSDVETLKTSIKNDITTEILGGASTDYNTLKKLQDLLLNIKSGLDNIGDNAALKTLIQSYIDDVKAGSTKTLKDLEDEISDLDDSITELEERIQSITFLPEYDDGKVAVVKGKITLDFLVRPQAAVTKLKSDLQSNAKSVVLLTNQTKTRASAQEFVNATVTCDASSGVVHLEADLNSSSVKTQMIAGNSCSVAMVVKDKDGNALNTSAFVPLLNLPVTKLEIKSKFESGSFVLKRTGSTVVGNVEVVVNDGKSYSFINNLSWTSEQTSVAEISTDSAKPFEATVTGKTKGTSKITVSYGGVSASADVTVKVPVKTITISPNEIFLKTGDKGKITSVAVTPEDYSSAITYTGFTGLSVNESREFTAPSTAGQYTITAKAEEDGISSNTINVYALALSGTSRVNLYGGNDKQYTETVSGLPNSVTKTDITWSITQTSKYSITPSSDGRNATIKYTGNNNNTYDSEATVTVTVKGVTLTRQVRGKKGRNE